MHCGLFTGEDQENDNVPNVNDNFRLNNSGSPLINEVQSMKVDNGTSLTASVEGTEVVVMPSPYFLGYTLPPGHPCNTFSLPPPPADKKRTGPRRRFSFLF